jgi:hypothetical protein
MRPARSTSGDESRALRYELLRLFSRSLQQLPLHQARTQPRRIVVETSAPLPPEDVVRPATSLSSCLCLAAMLAFTASSSPLIL